MKKILFRIIAILVNNALVFLALILWQTLYPTKFERLIVSVAGSLALVGMVFLFWFTTQFNAANQWYDKVICDAVGRRSVRIWQLFWLIAVLVLSYQFFFTDWIVRRM